MFDLVNDLEAYPRFIAQLSAAWQVKRDHGRRPTCASARMTIKFGPLTQAYTSRVDADPAARTITAKATDGPFAYLDSKWSFEPEGEGTRVRFDIDFKILEPADRRRRRAGLRRQAGRDHGRAFVDEGRPAGFG